MNPVVDILVACVVLLSIVCIGKLCNTVKICGVSLGCIWILFVGLLVGQTGIAINQEVSAIVKEYGLSIFIFEIGLEVGPKLLGKQNGKNWLISVLAIVLIVLGGFVAVIIGKIGDIDLFTLNGIMSGAVSNTPALGAAQLAAAAILGYVPDSIAQGYALAYPMGILGVFAIVLLVMGTNKESKESGVFSIEFHQNPNGIKRQVNGKDILMHIAIVVVGLILGRFIGKFTFTIGNLPAPFVLGNTAGTLFSAIILSVLIKHITCLQSCANKNDTICNLGLSLFIATVGLSSGAGLIEVLINGGYKWIVYGVVITLFPCLVILPIAKYAAHLSKEEVCGILVGATTNSPVFAYCAGESENPTEVSRTYACIYPVALLARVLLSQVFIFIV